METPDILDMGDYMEVVMTYKCRFCTFICSTIQEMGSHVKDEHLKTDSNAAVSGNNNKQAKEKNDIIDDIGLDVDHSSTTINQSQSLKEEGKLTEISRETNVSVVDRRMQEGIDENQQFFTTNNEDPGITISPVIQSLVEMAANEAPVQNLENTLDKIAVSETDDVINIASTPGITVPTIAENGNMTFTIDGKTVELTINDMDSQSNTERGSSRNVDTFPGELTIVDESHCINGENSQTITKEVFLCGQCNMGFESMEECKSHMFKDHDLNTNESDVEFETENKVSIGTQVEQHRKRGRKRKGEVKAEEEVRPNLEELEDSDVEWTIESEQTIRGSRSRRKIRPPKALESDYYIGKNKKKDNQLSDSEKKKECNIRCNFNGFNCYAKFSTQKALEHHLKCHVIGETWFKCYECSMVFPQWNKLRLHLWKKHQVDTDLLTCDVCGVYRSETMSKLLIHKEVHGEERPYTCDTCGKCFKQLSQMKNHQMTHEESNTSVKEGKWYHEKTCPICNRIFANKKCLDKHVQAVHGNEKPFACSFCPYVSARKAMLQLHVRTHTQEKPFKCEICGYSCGDHNSMRRHKMRHSGQRPYKCKFCPYNCIQAISLKMHMRNKHKGVEDGVFCCDKCTYKTVNEKAYKYHMEDHKNGLIQEGPPPTAKKKTEQIIVTTLGNVIQQEGEIVENGLVELQSESSQRLSSNQVEMQVQTLKNGETTISADDFAKLTNYGNLGTSDISAAQLISFALNAITQNPNDEEGEVNGVQTTVDSSANQEGVTMHTIRFHLPSSDSDSINNVVTTGIDTGAFKEGDVYHIAGNEPEKNILNQVINNVVVPEQQISQNTMGNETMLINFQGQNLPVNVISLDQAEHLMSQTATIQDLAQVSCLIKESLFAGSNTVENAENVEQDA